VREPCPSLPVQGTSSNFLCRHFCTESLRAPPLGCCCTQKHIEKGTPPPLLSCPPAVRHRRAHNCDTLQGRLAVPALCRSIPCKADLRVLVTAALRGYAGAASDAALVAELRDEVLRLQAELKGRADDMFWRTALAITQTLLMGRAASPVPFAADVALIAAARLGSEMFATSILLTGSAHPALHARSALYSTA
jgi:hypothetical protein